MDHVDSAQVVPDTSLLERTPEHDQLMFVVYLDPVVLLRRRVFLLMIASCPWNGNGNANEIFAKSCCRHQLASVAVRCSVVFVVRPTLGAGRGEKGAREI